jgi:hypothetical protein
MNIKNLTCETFFEAMFDDGQYEWLSCSDAKGKIHGNNVTLSYFDGSMRFAITSYTLACKEYSCGKEWLMKHVRHGLEKLGLNCKYEQRGVPEMYNKFFFKFLYLD